jgi:hypothetical protein
LLEGVQEELHIIPTQLVSVQLQLLLTFQLEHMGMLEEILLMYMQTPVEEMLNAMLEVVVGVQGVQDSLV